MNSILPAGCPQSPIDRWSPLAHVLILSLFSLLILCSGASKMPLIDRDEPRFAQAAQEMSANHNLITPYFNGAFRFDKPPYIYWNILGFYKIFGVREFTARLPSVLHTLFLVLGTYLLGRIFFSPRVGFMAALTLTTAWQIMLHGRLAVADMPMIFYLSMSLATLMIILFRNGHANSWSCFWIFYISQTLGFLAKGPIVQGVTILTLLLYRFVLWRQPLPWARLRIAWGLLIFVVGLGIWGIPALLQTHGLWWAEGIGNHVVARGMDSFNGRHYFLPFYFCSSPLSLCPWFALLGYAWVALRRNWSPVNAFLSAWILATYAIFTLYSTQLPHYILRGFPAIFLILGQVFAPSCLFPAWTGTFRRIVILLYALLALLLLASAWSLAGLKEAGGLMKLVGDVGMLTATSVVLSALCTPDLKRLKLVLVTLCLLSLALEFQMLGAHLRDVAPSLRVAELVGTLPRETRLIAAGYSEPSLVFYTNRHWELDQLPGEVAAAMTETKPTMIVQLAEEVSIDKACKWLFHREQKLPSRNYELELLTPPNSTGWSQAEVTGLNLARSSWVRLKLYYRQ